jgi:hypothetical protein
MAIELQKGSGIELKRRRQTFHAVNTSYVSTSSSQVRVEINIDKETMDFETGYLMFDIEAAKSGTTDTLSSNPFEASAWMRDIRVYDRAGREIGEQIRNYNGYMRKRMELLGNSLSQGADNYVGRLEGATSRAAASASVGLTAIERAHKFGSHIFDIKSYFPAQLLGGIVIEIDMEAAANCFFLDGTTDGITSYTLTNVRYVCDLVLLKPEAEAKLRSQLSRGLEIHYESPMNNRIAVTTNTAQKFDLGIANGPVKSIQAFMVLDASRNGVNEEYWVAFNRNNVSSYRFRHGSEFLTEKDVQVSASRLSEYLVEYLKSENLDTYDIINFYGDTNLALEANKFVIGQKVELSKDPSVASGIRDTQSNKLELDLNFSSAPAAATLYTNVLLDKVLEILPNREFRNKV